MTNYTQSEQLEPTGLTGHSAGGENDGQQQKQSAESEQQKQSEQ